MKLALKRGFTLAEVLIVIGILGIIAQATIPTLVQNVQNAQYKAMFKKEYSALNSAFTQALAENSGTFLNSGSYDGSLSKLLVYMNTSKTCGAWGSFKDGYYPGCPSCDPPVPANNPGDLAGQCFATTMLKQMNGGIASIGWPDMAGAVFTDGSDIIVGVTSQDCSYTSEYMSSSSSNPPFCTAALIDVNGFAKPNQLGKDIYGIWLRKDRIAPFGSNDSFVNTCNSSSTGWGCAAAYLQE